ncbi:MAG: Cys-Gln thioester bond-forming surface protein [Oscillospiraceae bacterium]|jgi:uncharacterized repeat protein (TIGR01451 family)|nr:Cys-Gln thioester bond-forming surface protein [Oscillospiraceae bacterium]
MNFKRILTAFLAVVMVLGILPFSVFAADWGAGDTLDDALSELKVGFADTQLDWLVLPSLGVIKLRYTYYMYKNERTGTVDETPVYCIDPTKGGAHEIVNAVGSNDDGSNTATYIRGEKVGDARYRAILAAGYPHNRFPGLGLQSIEEAYYATKLALWLYIRGNDPTKLTINPAYGDNDPVALRVRSAAVNIYNNGTKINPPAEPKISMTGKPNAIAKLDAGGEYYVQEIEVYASGWIGTNPTTIGDVQLSWGSAPPAGTIVLGTNGEDITSALNVKMGYVDGRSGNYGKVTVKYPATGLDANSFSPPTLTAEAIVPNNDIYVAYAQVNKDKYQRYLVERDPKVLLRADFVSQLSAPFEEDFPEDTGLRIRKVEAGTNIPLAGAVFEIRDPDGKLIYSLTTSDSGIIDIPLYVIGNYTVTEKTPPQYHLLPNERTQSVTVRYGEVAEVTFADDPYGTLRVIKLGAADGRPLGGAAVRIRHITTNTTREGITDSSGSAVFDLLPIGAWEIVELVAPNGFALDSTVHTVNVTPLSDGETSYTLTNKENPGLRIIKFDRQTMTAIAGVTFEVWRDGELFGEFVTNDWGEIEILNAPAGTYTAREKSTISPYVLDTTAQWIELTAGGGIQQLIFLNDRKPGIWLVKLDSSSLTAVVNAKFRIREIGGAFDKEFTTNELGEIDLSALDPATYEISEVSVAEPYLIDDAIRTVKISAGENAQFVFTNTKKPILEVVKYDAQNNLYLAGATFRIARIEDGSHYLDRVTDTSGRISIVAEPGIFSVQELAAPSGYVLNDTEYHVELFPGKTSQLVVLNEKKPSLIIKKYDYDTALPLPGAEFSVATMGGEIIWQGVISGANATVQLDNLDVGWVKITELAPPPSYLMMTESKDVYLGAGKTVEVKFDNRKKPDLLIVKTDAVTGEPVANVTFDVKKVDSTEVKSVKTDSKGEALLKAVDVGVWTVTEKSVPDAYLLAKEPTQTITLSPAMTGTVRFQNYRKPTLTINKIDSTTGDPIKGAKFHITYASNNTFSGEINDLGTYYTDAAGQIVLDKQKDGWFRITEETPAAGYTIKAPAVQEVYIAAGTNKTVVFENVPKSAIIIKKIDSDTGLPVSGATFTVRYLGGTSGSSGTIIFEGVTSKNGTIVLAGLNPGTYVCEETRPANAYEISNPSVQTAYITEDEQAVVQLTFSNAHKGNLIILKKDSVTKQPLSGATFKVTFSDGSVIGSSNGEYTTDAEGVINLHENLPVGSTVIVQELIAPQGYLLDSTAQTVKIRENTTHSLTFYDKPMSGLQIIKVDAVTKTPLKDAQFTVYMKSGEIVGTYTTNGDGVIILDNLEPGWLKIVESQAPAGYHLTDIPQDVEITSNQFVKVVFENTPMSGLLIVKTDEATGKPLKGVVFDVKRADGQFVAGNILDGNQPNTENNSPNGTFGENGSVTGSYTTDANGRIQINGLDAGQYMVVERKALDGYELDTEVHAVTVTPGKLATLQLTNRQKAGLRILKIDSVTKKGIYDVEFMVFDANNKVVGTYLTDNNGVIDFAGILTEGRYTLRETRAADGYYRDDMPRTVEFKSGKVTEIVWENTPQMGQIQILKKSGDDNEVNGLPAGTPLAGAIFEVYNYKSGNLVDRFISGTDGRAISKPLPLGRYTVKEVQAPSWYRLSTETLDIEIEFATQIIKREFLNYAANTGVKIRKVGNYEAMPGDTITYTIKEIANTSTVPLTDFYWRDVLPTDAVRLNKIVTGTYNQSLKYKILVTTNKGDTKIIADNLSTTQNNVIDCRNAALGLANDEYITSFTLVFGTVKVGFTKVTEPQVFVTVNKNLINGYQFANKADVGGKYGSEWVVGATSWVTQVYAQPVKLPRTGY